MNEMIKLEEKLPKSRNSFSEKLKEYETFADKPNEMENKPIHNHKYVNNLLQ